MRLTVLGSSASCAGPRQATAGHLIEGGGARVMFDCGHGVLANLQVVADPLEIDAIFVSHYHPDHYVDLFAYQALLRYAPSGPAGPIALYLPDGLIDRLKCLLSERGAQAFDEAFVSATLVDGEPVNVGGLTVTPRLVDHTEPTFALIAEADGARLSYTADTQWGDAAIDVACDADLLLCEATLPEAYQGMAPHLTAAQAGMLATSGHAGELVLSHVWPSNDRTLMAAEAASRFVGPVSVASEFDAYEVVPRKVSA